MVNCVITRVRIVAVYEPKQQGVLFTITILTSANTVNRSVNEMFETPNVDFGIQCQVRSRYAACVFTFSDVYIRDLKCHLSYQDFLYLIISLPRC